MLFSFFPNEKFYQKHFSILVPNIIYKVYLTWYLCDSLSYTRWLRFGSGGIRQQRGGKNWKFSPAANKHGNNRNSYQNFNHHFNHDEHYFWRNLEWMSFCKGICQGSNAFIYLASIINNFNTLTKLVEPYLSITPRTSVWMTSSENITMNWIQKERLCSVGHIIVIP